MNKKLLVVLVVVAAMLTTFTLVMGAKQGEKQASGIYEKAVLLDQQNVTPMPHGQLTQKQDAVSVMPDRSDKGTATSTAVGSVQGEINRATWTKDFCDLYGVPYYAIGDWFYGLEWYANYQDPEEFGCVDVWPFEVVEVGFNIQVDYAMDIDVQGYVMDADFTDPSCPVPGAILCETPVYTVSLPSDGHWIVGLPLTEQCCVEGPYFAGIYIYTDLYGTGADAVSEDDLTDSCRSYNDYGNGWEDLVVIYGWPGEMILWSNGYTAPQNDCGGGVDSTCELMHDNGGAASYFGSWTPGDQNAVYMDPEALCPDCDPVYPMLIEKVKGYFYDAAGAGYVDVTVHFYEVGGALCDGPGAEIYSFGPVTVTDFYNVAWAEITVPDVFCVEEPFFLAIEYVAPSTGIPSLLFDSNAPVDTCYQWNDYIDYGWIEWWDFWSTPAEVGWLMLRAVGICNSGACDQGVECNLIQDQGAPASYFGGFAAGDAIAKYFDPVVYCEEPVYPYKIHDVEFALYDFAGAGAVDVMIDVHMVCHDSCDGPGTQIYLSDPITVTTFYPDMAHIDLPEQICVWEPFFISIEYATGIAGSTPSFLFDDEAYPCDSCHAWIWYASAGYSPPWWEWSDFWEPPPPGCPIIRVSGFTEHPYCEQEPCDTTLETLWGALGPTYYWKQPPNDEFMNMQFEMPITNGGRLDEIQFAFYAAGTFGTPDPDFYVWLSDGTFPLDNNPPYQAIGEFHITYGDIAFFPAYTTVQTWDRGIMLDPGEKFHVGYCHAFEAGDTLSILSDDGEGPDQDRSSGWWNGAWEDYWPYDFMINAVICPEPIENPTFTIQCSPYLAFATPGDPPMEKYQVDVGSLLGYSEVVDLSCTPPAGINVYFDPVSDIAPFTSVVSCSVDAPYVYGDYTLTFCGLGADGQGPKCCDVILRVQPPYDEAEVPFYHGFQRATNFGAVGNDTQDNFMWNGISALFDGSFIVATTDDAHMALDIYNCEYVGWAPTEHMNCYYDPTYNANICFGHFFTPESVISCEYDSVFIVGIMEECIDFSIKIKVYYNPTTVPIYGMYMSLFEDWDVGDAYNNSGDMDPAHNLMWQYDPLEPDIVFGMMKAPFYDDPMYNMYIVPNPHYVWPGEGFCGDPWLLGDLYDLIATSGTGFAPWPEAPAYPDSDYSLMMTAGPIDLLEGDKHIEVWIDFGRNTADGFSWSQWWHRVLRYAGFYRGDVNASDTLELPALDVSDLVYLIQYLFQNGAAPLPYVDQGDVNGDHIVNVGDVVYLLNYVFLNGPAPIDYVRFIPQFWPRESLFENPNWD